MSEPGVIPDYRTKVINQNMEYLEGCVQETLQDFLRYVNHKRDLHIHLGGLRDDVKDRIKDNFPETIKVEDLIDFADGRKENGYQHIFLFQLDNRYADYLNQVGTPAYWSTTLKKPKVMAENAVVSKYIKVDPSVETHVDFRSNKRTEYTVYERPDIIWHAPNPCLTVVRIRTKPEHLLLIKWVETRGWNQMVADGVDQFGHRIYVRREFTERTVNFFLLHLTTGACELRVQHKRPNAEKKLRTVLAIYRDRINELFEFHRFRRVLMEPVIRHLLISHADRVRAWKILSARGKPWSGVGPPPLFKKLGILTGTFVGLRLKADWSIDGQNVRSVLYGKSDQIDIPKCVPPEHVSSILARIRRIHQPSILIQQLRKIVSDNPNLYGIVKKLDVHLSVHGGSKIKTDKFIDREWIDENVMMQVVDSIKAKASDQFQVQYYVVCPVTDKPIKDKQGRLITFTDRADIPESIACMYSHPKGEVSHPTHGNVQACLMYVPAATSTLHDGLIRYVDRPHGFIDTLEQHFGKVVARDTIKALFLLVFTTFYVGLSGTALWLFVTLCENHPEFEILVWCTYAIVLTSLVVLLIILFGDKPVMKAFRHVMELLRWMAGK